MKNVKAIIVLGVAAFGAAWLASPWFKLASVQAAIKNGDTETVVRMVDFNSVKDGLKRDLKTAISTQMPTGAGREVEVMGAMLLSGITDQFVETQVTPENLKLIIEHKEKKSGKESKQAAKAETETKDEDKLGFETGYQGLDKFQVRVFPKDEPKDTMYVFTLERDGLFNWKLIRADISGLFDMLLKGSKVMSFK